MDKELELYLTTVDRYLKNMPVSERIDVIKELKSCMEDLQLNNSLSTQEIVARLGSPKELAAGYLSEKIAMSHSFSLKKLLMVFSFYSLVSLSGMFIIPCGTVLSGGLLACSILGPVAALIKLLGFLFGFNVPFSFFLFGEYELHPLLTFPVTIALCAFLYWAGKALWKLVIKYIHMVSTTKQKLNDIA